MYCQFFGFTREPFARDIPAEHVYQSDQYKELSMRFQHMLEYRGLMLVTGDSGSGKTTALRALVSSLNKKLFSPLYLPLATVGVSDFYRQLNASLGGDKKFFKTALYRSIQEQLVSWVTLKNVLPVIILDEAHLLKDQNLRELQIIVNFKMDTTTPALFVLAGQTMLRKRLEAPMLDSVAQRIILAYHLGGLTVKETQKYVEHHLAVAGNTAMRIDKKAYEIVHQLSHGLPRKIGAIMIKTFMYAEMKKLSDIDADTVLVSSKEVVG